MVGKIGHFFSGHLHLAPGPERAYNPQRLRQFRSTLLSRNVFVQLCIQVCIYTGSLEPAYSFNLPRWGPTDTYRHLFFFFSCLDFPGNFSVGKIGRSRSLVWFQEFPRKLEGLVTLPPSRLGRGRSASRGRSSLGPISIGSSSSSSSSRPTQRAVAFEAKVGHLGMVILVCLRDPPPPLYALTSLQLCLFPFPVPLCIYALELSSQALLLFPLIMTF